MPRRVEASPPLVNDMAENARSCYEYELECDGDCGSSVNVRLRQGKDPETAAIQAAVAIGWLGSDLGRGKNAPREYYCLFCQERAKRISAEASK